MLADDDGKFVYLGQSLYLYMMNVEPKGAINRAIGTLTGTEGVYSKQI